MTKKLLFLNITLLFAITFNAQAQNQFLFQSVVRDVAGGLVCNHTVGVSIELLQGSATGMPVHTEIFTVKTNEQGLYSVIIGSTVALDNTSWNAGPYYVKSRVDVNGGSNYTVESVEKLQYVPFSMNANMADSLVGGAVRQESDPVFSAWDKSFNDITNKPVNVSTWVNDVGYLTSYTEVQVLSISNDTVFLTGGSFVKLPTGFDGDYNNLTNKPTSISVFANNAGYLTGFNEVQVLSIQGDKIYLTGGSFVQLPLVSESQNLSGVVGFGHSAGGHQLKDLQDPYDPQDVITRQYLDTLAHGYYNIDRGHHNVSVADECEGVYWNGIWYNQSGTYTYDYSDSNGYYSVDTLHLTIRHGDHHTYTAQTVSQYTWHYTTYYRSGTYMWSYSAANGCPSVDTLVLVIQNDTTNAVCTHYRQAADTAIVYACGSYDWHGQHIEQSGSYQHQLPRLYGQRCDSIVRVQVQVFPSFRIDTAVRSDSPVTWRGQTYSHQGDYADTLTDVNGCDSIYVLHLMMHGTGGVGAVPGRYSVAPGAQVLFAQGNLLYQAANNRWFFADNQYDQYNDPCIAAYYRPYTDIFSWATSGYHNAADSLNINYHPWTHYSTSATSGTAAYDNNRYGYGPSLNMPNADLIDSNQNYDWGLYNPIINGGNGSGEWHLLSKEQWDYLLNRRPNAANLRSCARVACSQYTSYGNVYYNYREGYIILADNWQCPSGISFTPDASSSYANQYNTAQWRVLQASGAVFLPAGFYWTSSAGDGGTAYCFNVNSGHPIIADYNRSNQYYVRLAQYATDGMTTCRCTHYDTVIVSSGPFTWHGHTYTVDGDYMDTLVNAAGCDSLIFFSLIIEGTGQINSLFSVSSTKQICFSKGNLQYNAKYNLWRFAPLQYDYFATYNRYISDTNRCWIDLFGWATSGYHDSTDNLNTAYHPWATSGSFGPSSNMAEQSIVNESSQYDWGVHNPIANGGNQAGQWRTLTAEEWIYLLNSRPNATNLSRYDCTVNGVKGLLLLPDNWTAPSGFVFNASDVYEGNDWALLEGSGAVFLPYAGSRTGTSVSGIGSMEYYSRTSNYWSSSARPYTSLAKVMYGYYGDNGMDRQNGFSVRLVKDY